VELSDKGELNNKSELKLELCNGLDNMEGVGYYKTINLVMCKDDTMESFEGEVR